jgi:hypothetical protein
MEGGALAVLDHPGGDRSSELWLGDRAGDPAQALHRHPAIRRDLRERDGAEPGLEVVGGQAERVRDTRVEGAAHTPQAARSGSTGGRHADTVTDGCLFHVKPS